MKITISLADAERVLATIYKMGFPTETIVVKIVPTGGLAPIGLPPVPNENFTLTPSPCPTEPAENFKPGENENLNEEQIFDAYMAVTHEFPRYQFNQKIAAIKRLREMVPSTGLADSKYAIEATPEQVRAFIKTHGSLKGFN